MKYNGKELIELSPEKWDSKSREIVGSECGWQHCAEIPKEEKEIEDLKKRKKELEFVLTCDGILNYGPIMEELKEINKILENL